MPLSMLSPERYSTTWSFEVIAPAKRGFTPARSTFSAAAACFCLACWSCCLRASSSAPSHSQLLLATHLTSPMQRTPRGSSSLPQNLHL